MALQRPFTLRLDSGPGNDEINTRLIIESLQTVVEITTVKCVTQTTRCTWQVTFDDKTARDVALCRGLDVSSRHYEFSLITGNYDGSPPAFVEVKMPYEMPDNAVRSLLSQYGHVTSVHRRKYAFAPTIESGVRIFKVVNLKGFIPPSFQIGRYRLPDFVRYAGQPPRCYRCGSEEAEHQIRNCPKPQSYRRCYVCGSGDHLYQQCPRYTADSVSSGHPESTDQPSCLPVSVLGGLSVDEAVSG